MRSLPSHRLPDAFTLVEVVLAISILGFGILAISGLFGMSLGMQTEATARSAAVRQLNNWFALTRSASVGAAWTQQAWEDGLLASPIPNFRSLQTLHSNAVTNLGPFWLSREGTPVAEDNAVTRLDIGFSAVNSNAFCVQAGMAWPAQSDNPRIRVKTVSFITAAIPPP